MPVRSFPPVAALVFAFGCGGSPPPDPAPPPPAQEPAPEGSEPIDWTSGLSEAEFIALHELTDRAADPLRGQSVTIDGTTGYLSLPEGATAPLPGVIVIHEWWGLNDHVRNWADRLAAEGYAALAVDLYGGATATTPDGAMELMRAVDDAAATSTLAAAHRFLVEGPRVRATHTAVIGWCFGGAWALRTAIAIPELDAAVMYYGRVVDDPEQLRAIEAPLLGIFANQDTSITPANVDAFERALTTAEVDHRILRYDADHAFANPSGARYARDPAEDAWRQVESFLAEHLRE